MTNLEIIKELYRSFSTKDYEAFLNICSPELEWIQNPGFPNGKRHQRAEAVVENVFNSFNTTWIDWGFHIEEYLEARDSIVVIGYYQGVHLAPLRFFLLAIMAYKHQYLLGLKAP